MAIIDIMETGKQGLTANRQALQTTSNNIANANTPGYSRQRAVLQATENNAYGPARLGGVELKKVIRVHDSFVEKQIMDESKTFALVKAKSDGLKRLEGLVHNDAFRIGDLVNGFFNDVRELSANPETMTLRTNVAASAKAAVQGFRGMSSSLKQLSRDTDGQISVAVDEVNTLARELGELNGSIAQFSARKEESLELEDRRNGVLRELSQKLGLQYSVDEQGNANISAGGIGILVHGTQVNQLTVDRTEAHDGKRANSLDVYIRDGAGQRRITRSMKEGEIGGLLHVRDNVVNPTLEHLDLAAQSFANNVNAVHRQGVGSDGKAGRDLFKNIDITNDAARLIDLSGDVQNSSENIAVGLAPGAADNRIALEIAKLQSAALIPSSGKAGPGQENTQTLNESLNSMVGKIATETRHEDQLFRHQEAILNQLENYRQSISGVNLDEEAINMMQYQTAFNASAKAMKVGDELLQTILSLK